MEERIERKLHRCPLCGSADVLSLPSRLTPRDGPARRQQGTFLHIEEALTPSAREHLGAIKSISDDLGTIHSMKKDLRAIYSATERAFDAELQLEAVD